jgi:aspartyl-tRNA(Asn)/glutamyl-tRNA(Gln) amidotransferase subunit B
LNSGKFHYCKIMTTKNLKAEKIIPTIGLEIHAELKTDSKMFCGCRNSADEKIPNLNICPVCAGQPGALPAAPNKKAVEFVIKTAAALDCIIAEFSKFDRKNYFYPDLPKGYQISQYDEPLSKDGCLEISVGGKPKKIRIRRIHLEEDTGKLLHPEKADYSLVDLNRAGAPLMELVTEPDIHSGGEAKKFCQELRLLFRYLDISDANMEKGQMRCEVNVSVSDSDKLGTKVEIKNLNSFKSVEKSIAYEIKRQIEALKKGENIVQETRGWDQNKEITFSQRAKEEAHDYRYFPEPDLPPLRIPPRTAEDKSILPELPAQKRKRFIEEYRLPEKDADILASDKFLAEYFENAVSELNDWAKEEKIPLKGDGSLKAIKLAANYLMGDVQYLLAGSKSAIGGIKMTPENLAELVCIVYNGKISSAAAKVVLAEMFATGGDPSNIIEEKGLAQESGEDALSAAIDEAVKNNPGPVGDYKGGKEQSLQFLVGQVMKISKGKANPKIVIELLKKKLS